MDGGQTRRDTKGNIIREGTVQTGGQDPRQPGTKGAAGTGQFVRGTDASEIEKAIIQNLIFTDIGKTLFVKSEGGKSVDAAQFLKANPDFRPSIQGDLDRFQGAGFFPDFALPTAPAPLPQAPKELPKELPRGKHGGRMTAEAEAAGRGVARQRFQVGGLPTGGFGINPFGGAPPVSGVSIPGIRTLPGQKQGPITQTSQTGTSESATEGTSEARGTGFTQNIADTGALDSIVQQLQGVQGFSNLGRSTLDDILRTGLPTDVSGITEAAKIRAGQEFDDASNVIGERLANLGLVSSSAQTTAVARERAKLGERVSAAGLEAEVAAAESASGRRFGGVGLDIEGERARSGALGQAGSLAASSANLNRRQETGFNRRGSTSSTTKGSTTSQGTVSQSNPREGTIGDFGPRGSSPRRVESGPRALGRGTPRPLGRSRNFNAEAFSRFAHGGRVPELDDVLVGALEGSTGFDVPTLTKADRLAAERGRIARFEEDNIGLQNARKEIGEFLDVNDPGILRMLLGGGSGIDASTSVANPGTNVTPGMQANIDRAAASALAGARGPGVSVGPNRARSSGRRARQLAAAAPPRQNRQNFALGGPVEGDPELIGAPNKGAVPQPTLPQEAGQVVPGLLDPRRQFFEDGGGVAPGIDSGQDKVPAMLRAEELVITPELTEELMNVDPGLPQPGLITALQQLAQQPLEFGEEEGEFVASDGGRFFEPRPGASEDPIVAFLRNLLGNREFQGPSPDISPEHTPELFGEAPFRMEAAVGDTRGAPKATTAPKFAGKFLPGAETDFDAILREEPDFGGPTDFSVPGPPLRGPSFSESVGEAGERSFTLSGGSPGTGRVGDAGIQAGLDPSKGILSGGDDFAPGVSRQAPGSAGTISGSASIVDPATGLPVDFSGQQLDRLDRAKRIADLTRSAIRTDPIGGPEKQARMLRALEVANREVDSAVNEMIQEEQLAIQRQQLEVQGVVAQGQLNTAMAQSLAAEAQKITAEGTRAKQILEAQANNPVLTKALNDLSVLAENPDADDDTRAQIFALIQFQLQQHGIELTEAGLLDFFGPDFRISPSTPQQGIPTQAPGRQGLADGGIVQPDSNAGVGGVVNDGNQELQALMSRAKAGMSPEDFQHIMEIM